MAHRPHPKKARTNPRSPRAFGTCQRCGFIGNVRDFETQHEWAGLQLISLNLQVCDTCLDRPQRQLGSIVLPPDPEPVMNALPESYAIDEYWPRLVQGGQPRYLQGGRPRYLQVLKYYDTN